MNVPDYVGDPIVAWRVWIIDERLGLGSVMKSVQWPPRRPLRATCISPHRDKLLHAHESPALGERCPCGIYAVKRAEDAAAYIANFSDVGVSRAVGLVSMWGRVVEGEDGWRSEFAYPRRAYVLGTVIRVACDLRTGARRTPIALLERPDDVARRLQDLYGIPVTAVPGGTPHETLEQLSVFDEV